MKLGWQDVWGSADGSLRRLSPHIRILCGLCGMAVCLTAPAETWPGILFIICTVLLWIGLCSPPTRIVRSMILFGLILFGPYFLLVPIIKFQSAGSSSAALGWEQAVLPPWRVFFRGMAMLLTTVSAATTLSFGELRRGLHALPIPQVMAAIIVQIVHQTSTLIAETRRVAAAVAVRGGSRGLMTVVRMMRTLPLVWLPRIMNRAERVALAMELRGYRSSSLFDEKASSAAVMDVCAVLLAALLVGVSLLLLEGGVL